MTDNNINNNQGQYHKGSFTNYQKKDITYEINERLGIISEDMNGWTRELNLVSWNGGKAKFDLREWSPEHDKMGKAACGNPRVAWSGQDHTDAPVHSQNLRRECR